MDWNIVELKSQYIYLNKYGKVNVDVFIPFEEFKSDLVISFDLFDNNWYIDHWFQDKNKEFVSMSKILN